MTSRRSGRNSRSRNAEIEKDEKEEEERKEGRDVNRNTQKMKSSKICSSSSVLVFASFLAISAGQVQRSTIDFANAVQDPQTGQLCVMQQVCIADVEALSRYNNVLYFTSKPCCVPFNWHYLTRKICFYWGLNLWWAPRKMTKEEILGGYSDPMSRYTVN